MLFGDCEADYEMINRVAECDRAYGYEELYVTKEMIEQLISSKKDIVVHIQMGEYVLRIIYDDKESKQGLAHADQDTIEQESCEYMSAEKYRQRMIQAFHNADTDELIAVCVLPTEKEFEHLEWLLKTHYKKEPCEDCISRDELLKAIDTWDKFGCDADTKLVPYQDHYIPYIHYDDVVKCIKGMPSVTPKPKMGHWILSDGYWRCSKCREKALLKFDNFGIRTPEYIHVESNYCPNCGAKMEVEE